MESFKERIPVFIGIVLFLALCGVAYYFMISKQYYYTQIDNTKIKEITNSDMKYEYNLKMYKEDGKSKDIKFKTSRELREKAFLKIKYYYISGVNKWEEVQYDELPSNVKNKYTNPNSD